MSLLDPRQKTISLKVVYYGPGLGGKTTSLKQVHRVIDPAGRVKLVSLDTDEDRTLFFDFLPIELGVVGRFKIKIQGFTVPGQVKYNMTRRYVLTGADGIVFVADSDPSRVVENVESLINLGDNLRAHGLNVNNIPLVFQYNKQDLASAVSPGELEEKLNFRKVPGFATVATRGDGVFDAFVAVSKLMVSRVIKTYNLKQEQADEERILREVESRLHALGAEDEVPPPVASFNPEATMPTPSAPAASPEPAPAAPAAPDTTAREADDFFGAFTGGSTGPTPAAASPSTQARPEGPPADRATAASSPAELPSPAPPPPDSISSAEPPAAAIEPARAAATTTLAAPPPPPVTEPEPVHPAPTPQAAEPPPASPTSASSRTRFRPPAHGRDRTELGHLLRSLREIGRGLAAGAPIDQSVTVILSSACQLLDAIGGSLLVLDRASGRLEGRFTNGHRNDPLLLVGEPAAARLLELLRSGGDQLIISEELNGDLHGQLAAVSPGVESAVVAPLVIGDEVEGALCVYLDEPLDLAGQKDALKALMVLAYQAAVGIKLSV